MNLLRPTKSRNKLDLPTRPGMTGKGPQGRKRRVKMELPRRPIYLNPLRLQRQLTGITAGRVQARSLDLRS